ncbi:MAG: hypothetical protein ACXAE3_13175 [Candidatus Kariarchaeaceae archaeon]|jgi:hypothetical protein
MAPFPDNLPPEGLDPIYKLLLYYGLVFLLATAFTTKLITRRRSFPKTKVVESNSNTSTAVASPSINVTDSFNFQGTAERLASLIVEEYANEKALGKLNELKDQINTEAFQKMNITYNDRLAEIKMEIDSIQESMVSPEPEIVATKVVDDRIDEDLERQLMDLDDDDFLKPRKKKDIDEIFEEEKPTPVQTPEPTPVAPPQKAATPIPSPPASEPKAAPTPMPPAPAKSEVKSPAPMPPAPVQKATPPPPPGKAAPAAAPPAAAPPAPVASEPLSAAQPMKVQSDQDDAMFAKSTSIAALRMDMLRELARLKKLIPEDQEKE